MAGSKPDALTDDLLDRELSAAFAVDHSPEFLARVRTRIAAEPAPRSRWVPFVMLAACAAAVVVLVAALVVFSRPPASDVPVATTTRADVPLSAERVVARPSIAPRVESRPVAVARPAQPIASTPVRHEPVETPRAEVLISRSEQIAFERFVQMARGGELPPPANETRDEIHEISTTEIAIHPIEIAPLNDSTRQGEGS